MGRDKLEEDWNGHMQLVSACLCGKQCKYNGGSNMHPCFLQLLLENKIVPVCPELLAGLPIPRSPSEIRGGSGENVLDGKARVFSKEGIDLTACFLKGARNTLEIARQHKCSSAILKSRSPSCGVGQIYDGTFTSRLIPGDGVTAALLKRNGIEVKTEEDI